MFVSRLCHLTWFAAGITCAMQIFGGGDITSGGNDGVCAFDMCVIVPNFCSTDEECITNANTCQSKCTCADNQAGRRCGEAVESQREPQGERNAGEQTPRSRSTNVCGHIECHHGNCMNVFPIGFQCVCKEGWFGESCNLYGTAFDARSFNIQSESENQPLVPIGNVKTFQDFSTMSLVTSSSMALTTTPASMIPTKTQNRPLIAEDRIGTQHVKSGNQQTGVSQVADQIWTLLHEIQNSRNPVTSRKSGTDSSQSAISDIKDNRNPANAGTTGVVDTRTPNDANKNTQSSWTFLHDIHTFVKPIATDGDIDSTSFTGDVNDAEADVGSNKHTNARVSNTAEKILLQEMENFVKSTTQTFGVNNEDTRNVMNAGNSELKETRTTNDAGNTQSTWTLLQDKTFLTDKNTSNTIQPFSMKDAKHTINDDKTEHVSTEIQNALENNNTSGTFVQVSQSPSMHVPNNDLGDNSTKTIRGDNTDANNSHYSRQIELQNTDSYEKAENKAQNVTRGITETRTSNDTDINNDIGLANKYSSATDSKDIVEPGGFEMRNSSQTDENGSVRNSTSKDYFDIADKDIVDPSDFEEIGSENVIKNLTTNASSKIDSKESVEPRDFDEMGNENITQMNEELDNATFIHRNTSITTQNFTQEIEDEKSHNILDINESTVTPEFNYTHDFSTSTVAIPEQIHSEKRVTETAGMKETLATAVQQMDVDLQIAGAPLNQRYNVCSEHFVQRSLSERKCATYDTLTCVYGVCEQTEVNHGTWKGYVTDCKCDHGARGTFCDTVCCLDCGLNGKCVLDGTGNNITERCNCRQRYTGLSCEIFVPDPVSIQMRESTWYIWIVGVCVGTFVVMVTLAIIAPYFMWKHRVLLVMKIVHYFQAYEDDDEKEWDAFVSYKSHPIDESFVVDVLYPKLEQELGFKLCLHFRDFMPGETISNNIINAVEGSRRTIIILTPRYVESEFTRFEYQKAQTEMLKRKHRIIPIVLEDISDVKSNMDKNLRGIINSVTYLEWPNDSDKSKKEDKFWKRLQLSLPKKKVLDSEKELYPFAITGSGSGINNSIPIKAFSESSTGALTPFDGSARKLHRNNTDLFNVSLSDDADEETYFEIGQIDETLTEMIQPLTDAEEAELNKLQVPDTAPEVPPVNPYTRYMEFKIEDNPPSPSLLRSLKQQPKSAVSKYCFSAGVDTYGGLNKDTPNYTSNNYLELRIEDNPPSPNLRKRPQQTEITPTEDRYIELDIEEFPPLPNVLTSVSGTSVSGMSVSGTSGTHFVNPNTGILTENNSPIHDLNAHSLQGTNKQYVECNVEDKQPFPSLDRSRKQPNDLSHTLSNELTWKQSSTLSRELPSGSSRKEPNELSRKQSNELSRKQSNELSRKHTIESYTEDGYEDIIQANISLDGTVPLQGVEDGHINIVNEDCYTYPSSRIKPSTIHLQPRGGISLANDGYFEAAV